MSKRIRWIIPALIVMLTFTGLRFAALHVRAPGPEARDWEEAAPTECDLLAQSIRAIASGSENDLRLMGERAKPETCQWDRWGLQIADLSQAEFDVATRGDKHNSGYIPHLSLSKPRYSWFHLRAAVAVGIYYGWLGGEGSVCYFRREIRGWVLAKCQATWVA